MSYVDSATDPNAKPDPSTPSSDYDCQIEFWCMVDAILGGEALIKAGRQKYLPKFKKEKDEVYDYRLKASPFTNVYGDISRTLASKPFSKELVLKEKSPDQYVNLAENIDGQGNNLHVFCAAAFKTSLDKGVDWILVDYSKAPLPQGGPPRTVDQVNKLGVRPYWVHVSAQQMISVHSCFVDGVEKIFEARIKEDSTELEVFKEKTIERIRSFNRQPTYGDGGTVVALGPATWTLYEKHTSADGKVTWDEIDNGDVTIGIIPLVPVIMTKRCGGGSSWTVEPALRDLAHMQITEYRQESNLEWVKIMTCFPMVAVIGMETRDDKGIPTTVTVGPNEVFMIPQNMSGTGGAGDVKIVEPGAQSITENRNQLELTRKEMRELGMQPLAEANLTVFTSANISKKASSSVQAWVFLFKDAIEQALKYTAMWLEDKTYEPEIIIHTDFAIELESGKELDALLKAEASGIYSKQTVRGEFKRRDIVSNDLNDEEEQQRIAEEQQGLQPEQAIDPVTGELVQPSARPKVITNPPPTAPPKPAPTNPPPTIQ